MKRRRRDIEVNMITDFQKIKNAIEDYLLENAGGGYKRFIIYPFGEYGMLTKKILNDCFGIQEEYIVDNKLAKYNPRIKNLNYFKDRDVSEYIIFLTNANPYAYKEIRQLASGVFNAKNIIDIFPIDEKCINQKPKCGKYSYGSLCNNELVESIGAFSSIASTVQAVVNHPVNALSTHPFLYWDRPDTVGYFPGVSHRTEIREIRKSRIGNDVWLGQNVIITNGAHIGNGVIAAAGAVITKDVPDYAVVAGVPARIMRYRYTPEQINALNKIAWWDWSDEKIRECYDDFFEDIDVFISKHEGDH